MELVQEWLDLRPLGGAIELADMKGSKDLKKAIAGEDGPEEWQVGCAVGSPVVFQVV